jgi:hypothetical protein
MHAVIPFTRQDFHAANLVWGCNCGPTALAWALGRGLEDVRKAIPQFEQRGYTSPTMMRAALAHFAQGFDVVKRPRKADIVSDRVALVRVAWSGPWDGQRYASRYSHWFTTWQQDGESWAFDCNGMVRPYADWCERVAPALAGSVNRCNGNWFPLNVWRLT